jgi:glycine betaine/proline transport system ATP-binding protein
MQVFESGQASPASADKADISGPASTAPTAVLEPRSVVLELRDISKVYKSARGGEPVAAVRGVSLKLQRGEVLCLMGTSGSGKSTLLRHVNRLVEASSGQVLIDGVDVGGLSPKALRALRAQRIGMVFQHFGLLPHRTVRENVALPLELRGEPADARQLTADRLLATVGLAEWADHYPAELSGGMQQRVGLARALANDPDILLMDEPFSALDPTIRRDLQASFLRIARERGITTLLVTHDPAEALRIADRIAVMRDGCLVQVGTPEELLSHPADAGVADFFVDHAGGDVTPKTQQLAGTTSGAAVETRGVSLRSLPSALLGPAAFATQGRSGAFGASLLVELFAAAWLGVEWHAGATPLAFLAALLWLINRATVVRCTTRATTLHQGGWALPLLLLLATEALVGAHGLGANLGPLAAFPASLKIVATMSDAIDQAIDRAQVSFETVFACIVVVVRTVVDAIQFALGWLPWPVPVMAVVFAAWRVAGLTLAVFSAAALGYLGLFGFWDHTIATLALVGCSVLVALLLGVPTGILLAKRPTLRSIVAPLLDVMQTLPSFVYLIPAVAFFSVGKTPAVIATVVFALAPVIRLTVLGIQEVPKAAVEAAEAHGATWWQTLTKVELPLARGSLLLGVNQTIVMSLSMVVVAALIGADGLGYDVMTALRNVKSGDGVLAGIAIVLCAVIPDRILQSALKRRHQSHPTQ